MGLLSALPEIAKANHSVDPQELLNIAATAEVLATIVNTVGNERVNLDAITKANVEAAAREELIHYQVLTSSGVGGEELTKRIWHRALALQSLGVLGNDRVFMKYSQPEENQTDPFFPKAGFRRITSAVDFLKMAGFGFGEQGSKTPGTFYEFDEVSRRTPDPAGVNTRTPR